MGDHTQAVSQQKEVQVPLEDLFKAANFIFHLTDEEFTKYATSDETIGSYYQIETIAEQYIYDYGYAFLMADSFTTDDVLAYLKWKGVVLFVPEKVKLQIEKFARLWQHNARFNWQENKPPYLGQAS